MFYCWSTVPMGLASWRKIADDGDMTFLCIACQRMFPTKEEKEAHGCPSGPPGSELQQAFDQWLSVNDFEKKVADGAVRAPSPRQLMLDTFEAGRKSAAQACIAMTHAWTDQDLRKAILRRFGL